MLRLTFQPAGRIPQAIGQGTIVGETSLYHSIGSVEHLDTVAVSVRSEIHRR